MKKILITALLALPVWASANMQQVTVNLHDTSTFLRESGTSNFVHANSDMKVMVRAKQNLDGVQTEREQIMNHPNYMVNQDMTYSISVPSNKMRIIDNTNGHQVDTLADAKYEVAADFSKINVRLSKDEILEAYGAQYEEEALRAAGKLIGAASLGKANFQTRITDLKCESDLETLTCSSAFAVRIVTRD